MFFLELLCHGLILELDNELNIVVGASDVNSSLEGLTPIPHYCHNSQCQQSNLETRVASAALLVNNNIFSCVDIFDIFLSFLVVNIYIPFVPCTTHDFRYTIAALLNHMTCVREGVKKNH